MFYINLNYILIIMLQYFITVTLLIYKATNRSLGKFENVTLLCDILCTYIHATFYKLLF